MTILTFWLNTILRRTVSNGTLMHHVPTQPLVLSKNSSINLLKSLVITKTVLPMKLNWINYWSTTSKPCSLPTIQTSFKFICSMKANFDSQSLLIFNFIQWWDTSHPVSLNMRWPSRRNSSSMMLESEMVLWTTSKPISTQAFELPSLVLLVFII